MIIVKIAAVNKLNYLLRSALGISKTEANGIMLLIPVMFMLIASPYFYQYAMLGEAIALDYAEMDKLTTEMEARIKKKDSLSFKTYKRYETNKSKKFEYLTNKYPEKRFDNTERTTTKYTKPVITSFDLNMVDTTGLKRVYGIGPVLANRIVKYRELLGGFTSKSQLREVYGLQDSVILALDTLAYIGDTFNPSQLNINQLDENTLKKHPYFSWKEANAIINYRYQHGEFKSAEDLRKIHLLDSSKISRLLPYITF
ncbi:ComEA family DNA-binding protein [Fulvivirga lutea]|uniref:Helix-hairpin-helix domain-containing protein n=1 Tax=Fulvivirga lutea TaxID=2810512 RepID=A0A975A2H4_9BACT|nr:helix-hairpin-helix domain-containing protein [Fulvivirga lutea]QSE98846.1 helix-hairpin-helix domain-containing protein [Fulvivirga lutea]